MQRHFKWLFGVLLSVSSAQALAGPADYVYSPKVEKGEGELELVHGSSDLPAGGRATATSLSVGYGVTENWFSSVYLKRSVAAGKRSDFIELENKFQLTEHGDRPIHLGLITELELPLQSGDAVEVKFGPLLQSDFGKLQLNGNLVFERVFGQADEHGTAGGTQLGYQWQAKYHWQSSFGFGVQGMGDLGQWDNWDVTSVQNHRAGIMMFGKVKLSEETAVKYNVAALFGVTDTAPNQTYRFQLEYEF